MENTDRVFIKEHTKEEIIFKQAYWDYWIEYCADSDK